MKLPLITRLLLSSALLAPAGALAQTLPVVPVPLDSVSDSARAAWPASHRTAETEVDQEVRVIHCPPPPFPNTPAVFGYPVRVEFVFVVDTLGRPEVKDMLVLGRTDQAFVRAARRAISKCRYEPARKAGRPVRYRVQQAVVYRGAPEWPFDSGSNSSTRR